MRGFLIAVFILIWLCLGWMYYIDYCNGCHVLQDSETGIHVPEQNNDLKDNTCLSWTFSAMEC